MQGIGYRPFVYRLAHELGVNGWVNNSTQGVFIDVEGPPSTLEEFLYRLSDGKPPPARIASTEHEWREPVGYVGFEIHKSDESGAKTAFVTLELATCRDCLEAVLDPEDRRYRYPFTNCTNCGPRFSILEALPYDRPNTTMKFFKMCERCRAEYEAPARSALPRATERLSRARSAPQAVRCRRQQPEHPRRGATRHGRGMAIRGDRGGQGTRRFSPHGRRAQRGECARTPRSKTSAGEATRVHGAVDGRHLHDVRGLGIRRSIICCCAGSTGHSRHQRQPER